MTKKSRKDIYRVILPCKGYVKAWLLRNYRRDDPDWPELVSLSHDKVLNGLFVSYLQKGESRFDNQRKGTRYTEELSIEITYDQFVRYGWMLSMTSTIRFNTYLESRVKQLLYSYVGALRASGMPLMECVRRFRERTGISEWLWDTDSIRKDLQRHLHIETSMIDDFWGKIEEKVWKGLSDVGTPRNNARQT